VLLPNIRALLASSISSSFLHAHTTDARYNVWIQFVEIAEGEVTDKEISYIYRLGPEAEPFPACAGQVDR
jgi:hypothetical protein